MITLHLTTESDLPLVHAWEHDPENVPYVESWKLEQHRNALRDRTVRHFVIDRDNEKVGYVILAGVEGSCPVVEFRRIVVALKGSGIGQRVVEQVLQYAFNRLKASAVWLDYVPHNARAAHIYTKFGFRIDHGSSLWGTIAGKRTPLVKMVLSRDERPDQR